MVERFLATLPNKNTRNSYQNDLAQLYAYFAPADPLQLGNQCLDEYRSFLIHSGSPATTNRKLAAIRSYFTWAETVGLAAPSTRTLKNVKQPRKMVKLLSEAEIAALLKLPAVASQDGLRDALLLNLLFVSGMRISEALGFTQAAVDYSNQRILVTGKGDKDRFVFITNKVAQMLAQMPDPVFQNCWGQQLTVRGAQLILKKYGSQIGRPDLHPHLLRHQFATTVLRQTGDVATLSQMMGHTSVSTTQIYLSFTVEVQAAQHQKVFQDE